MLYGLIHSTYSYNRALFIVILIFFCMCAARSDELVREECLKTASMCISTSKWLVNVNIEFIEVGCTFTSTIIYYLMLHSMFTNHHLQINIEVGCTFTFTTSCCIQCLPTTTYIRAVIKKLQWSQPGSSAQLALRNDIAGPGGQEFLHQQSMQFLNSCPAE